MAAPPKLRPVSHDDPAPTPAAVPSSRDSALRASPWWIFVVLAATGYAVLAYIQSEQRTRIATLESEVTTLQSEVTTLESELESRERLIEAQTRRLSDVRSQVDALADLLEAPIEPSRE